MKMNGPGDGILERGVGEAAGGGGNSSFIGDWRYYSISWFLYLKKD